MPSPDCPVLLLMVAIIMVALDPPLATAAIISAGGEHTCALRDDARVVCWGSDAAAVAPTNSPLIQLSAGWHMVAAYVRMGV
ncbi:MAG: hypothetical protein ACREVK_10805 [Gammaproteobacteria bacterium]